MSFGLGPPSLPHGSQPLVTTCLWSLTKAGHRAEARVRTVEGVGVELRYEWNGELRESQVFREKVALDREASGKRSALEARGWHAEAGD